MTQPEVILWGRKQGLWSRKGPRVCKFLLSNQMDLNSGLGCQVILHVTLEGLFSFSKLQFLHPKVGTIQQDTL